VTTLLDHHLSWTGFGQAMLILALVWWAWSAFVWAANVQHPGFATMRAALLGSSVLIFICGLVIPHSFSSDATLFAVSYAGVRLVHLALYADASRKGNASWSAIAGFGLAVIAGMVLLVTGSFLGPSTLAVLWVLAAAIDYAGPAWLTRERLRGLQEVAVAHFAERYGLFILICLGESIVAIGIGAGGKPVSTELVAAVVFALVTVIAVWWIYFARFADIAQEQLRVHKDPVLAAADGYSYLHLLLVAGIVIFAVGLRFAVHDLTDPLSDAARLALYGGLALYLSGIAAVRWRLTGDVGYEKLLTAALLIAAFALTSDVAAWLETAIASAFVVLLCVYESWNERFWRPAAG